MTDNVKNTRIFYNPNCTKCRLSLQLLNEKGIEPEIIEYLTDTPDFAAIENILDLLGIGPRELMRTHEKEYEALDLGRSEISRHDLIQAMIDNPVLIERPIVIKDGKATIGRPPEKILDLLS